MLIDYGFFGPGPIGFDLSQLLVGDVQVGRRSGDDLAAIDDAIFAGYMAGLRAEECWIPDDVVRRAHALQLMLFTGLSTLPLEHLDQEPTAGAAPPRGAARGHRAVQPRPVRRDRLSGYCLAGRVLDRVVDARDRGGPIPLGVVGVEHRALVERVVAGQGPVELLPVERLGPVADEHRRDRVAREVGQRARLGHEPVDADDEADAFHELRAVRGEAAGERGQACAGDTGSALRGDDHEQQQGDLLADGERLAQRVGDEDRGHRQVDRGPVEVERVAGRDDHARPSYGPRRRARASRSRAAVRTPRTRSRGSAGTRARGT